MALKKCTFRTKPEHAGVRLDQVLTEMLPHALGQDYAKGISKGKVRKLIIAGAVYLNKKRVRIASKAVIPNAQIEVYVDLERLSQDSVKSDQPFEMSQEHVLFEDEFLIVVNKPAGLPTQPTLDEARDNLFKSVKNFLAKREGIPETQVYLGLHHRLDRDTSGVLLLTKKKEANAGIAHLFSEHRIQKTYRALCSLGSSSAAGFSEKPIPQTWTIKNFLGRAQTRGKASRFESVHSGGDPAHTDFKIIEKLTSALHVQAEPRTGRTHQIRVHLSENKMPILGDPFYGGLSKWKDASIERVMLHAWRLKWIHPITQAEIQVEAPLPKDFQQTLKVLQRS